MFSDTPSSSTNNNPNNNTSNCSSNSSNKSKSYLCNFGYLDYIVLASSLAIALAEELGEDDLEILAAFLDVLSDELTLITTIQGCSSDNDDEDTFVPLPAVPNSRTRLKRKKKIKRIVKKKVKRK